MPAPAQVALDALVLGRVHVDLQQEVHAPAKEERQAPADLLEALRASVDAAKRSNGKRSNGKRSANGRSKPRKRRRAKTGR